MPDTPIRRERMLPVRGEMSATIGSKLDPLDVIARATPPRVRRAISLTRLLGVREADVPKRLLKQAGDLVEAREIIIAKPINLGFQQLIYRSPGPGAIAAIQGSWMVLDLDGPPFELKALYRGSVASVIPRLGAVVEGEGALIQGVWGSGKEGYGVLKMMAKAPDEVLEAESITEDVHGAILVTGAAVTEDALRRALSLKANGVVTGGLDPRLGRVAEELPISVIVTEGFGRIAMSTPIFEQLRSHNGQEAAINGFMRMRGRYVRPEIFVPLVDSRPGGSGLPKVAPRLTVQPGASVRIVREPYMGQTGTLPQELVMTWTSGESGSLLPGIDIELDEAIEGERHALVPWTDLELIG